MQIGTLTSYLFLFQIDYKVLRKRHDYLKNPVVLTGVILPWIGLNGFLKPHSERVSFAEHSSAHLLQRFRWQQRCERLETERNIKGIMPGNQPDDATDEDATELKFPKEFEQADTLLTSEVYLLLEHRRQQSEQKVRSLDKITNSSEFHHSSWSNLLVKAKCGIKLLCIRTKLVLLTTLGFWKKKTTLANASSVIFMRLCRNSNFNFMRY
uniref:Uncharacterized protein n=1 Tax=Elaeophora elaphi TaxID=1147741 RepID=A0A0R3RNL6_9BILA